MLTVIVTCMGRLHHMRQSLPLLVLQPGIRCIVVDYGCPDRVGDWTEQNFPEVDVVRAGPVTHFNVAKARNLGARHARAPWLCFMDADTLVAPGFMQQRMDALREKCFYRAEPCPQELVGLVICPRADFEKIGGYDEVFEGWACEDRDLYARLRRSGCTPLSFAAESLQPLVHDDTQRTRHHGVADRFLSLRINGMYLQIKTDLARLLEQNDLSLEDRRELYARIRQRILANPDAVAQMDVALPRPTDFTQPPGWRLDRTISYRFEPLKP